MCGGELEDVAVCFFLVDLLSFDDRMNGFLLREFADFRDFFGR
jgi:hypothetical protein